MHRTRRGLLAAVVACWGCCTVALAADEPPNGPYTVEVWADALFDQAGKLDQLNIPDAERYPAAFVERVKRQLASAKIPPVTDEGGAPATFQTGVQIVFDVTPGGPGKQATVRMAGMQIAPRPVKRFLAIAPDELQTEIVVSIRMRCEVGIDGRCQNVSVVSADGTSDALRRWGQASMRGWSFEPQRVNGKPVSGESENTLLLEAAQTGPARDFRDPRRL